MEPIGTSQVLRPVLGLAARGFDYTILSLEKRADLLDRERQALLEAELASCGVRWLHAEYRTDSARGVASNVATLATLATREMRGVDLLHARAHLSAAVAWGLSRITATPYVFDFRGYWVDELREQGRWVTDPAAYLLAKAGERRLVRDAAAIVCLTDLARDEIRAGMLGRFPRDRQIATITTTAEYDKLTREGPTDRVPDAIRARLEGKLVVGYVGAINASYAYRESLTLVRKVMSRREDVHLLCLTRQTDAMSELLRAHDIGEHQSTITNAPHEDMPHWLRSMDWCLLLLNEPYAKRGSMPTKLAELFAAEVRPIQHGCNAEVRRWVDAAGSGVVLKNLEDDSLESAAERIASSPRDPEVMARARRLTAEHFGASAGIDRYAALLSSLVGAPRERSDPESAWTGGPARGAPSGEAPLAGAIAQAIDEPGSEQAITQRLLAPERRRER
ncbi:MAG: hypothetical protein M3Y87_00065 [Myxococcota bacterium]|nr:hypothetical protein [Myxococcota bacterium]